jgi:hypothetical protein
MTYTEIEYSEELWDKLYAVGKHTGGSLHCDEWLSEYEGKTYRLIWCSTDIKMIELLHLQNQCDGCMNGDPINKHNNHTNEDGKPYMGCQKNKYER